MSSKEIPLTQGKVAVVDEEDFDRLNKHKWYACKNGNTFYALRKSNVNGKRLTILMHREILGLKPGDPGVDHRDGNGLNNRRKNLRLASHEQNGMNRRRNKNGTSRFKGVYWEKNHRKWHVRIKFGGKYVHIGYFDSEEDAARAYDEKAKELFGEFARLNKVGENDGRKAEDQF